jgi:hypothetical protein
MMAGSRRRVAGAWLLAATLVAGPGCRRATVPAAPAPAPVASVPAPVRVAAPASARAPSPARAFAPEEEAAPAQPRKPVAPAKPAGRVAMEDKPLYLPPPPPANPERLPMWKQRAKNF